MLCRSLSRPCRKLIALKNAQPACCLAADLPAHSLSFASITSCREAGIDSLRSGTAEHTGDHRLKIQENKRRLTIQNVLETEVLIHVVECRETREMRTKTRQALMPVDKGGESPPMVTLATLPGQNCSFHLVTHCHMSPIKRRKLCVLGIEALFHCLWIAACISDPKQRPGTNRLLDPLNRVLHGNIHSACVNAVPQRVRGAINWKRGLLKFFGAQMSEKGSDEAKLPSRVVISCDHVGRRV